MKIGIVTQPLSRNYGGILQNYALQQVLIQLGHSVFTYDLGKYTWRNWIVVSTKNLINKIIGKPYWISETPTKRKRQEKCLRSFVESHIHLISPRCHCPSTNTIIKYDLNAIIVGSDQVWRPKYNKNIYDMYLQFAKENNIKRIAYAASFGTSSWEYTQMQTEKCRLLAQKFDAISVREESAIAMCKEHLGVNAHCMVDPTLLLSYSSYNSIIEDIPKSNKAFLFAYILDRSESKIKFVNDIANHLKLDVIIKGAESEVTQNDTIELWLSYFRDAKYVMTDSFHGSVFSIIYNKNFKVFTNDSRGTERMISLLNLFDLNECLVHNLELENSQILQKIDWESVNIKLNIYRQAAIDFINSNLNQSYGKS